MKKSLKKILIIIGIILAIIILVICALIYYFFGTPQYSIIQLHNAYNKHDVEMAENYIDIDKLTDQMVEKAIEITRQKIKEETEKQTYKNDWEKLGAQFGSGLIELMIPTLEQKFKDEIKKGFIESIEGKNDSKIIDVNKITIKDLFIGNKVEFFKEGSITYFAINDDKQKIVFRMKKILGHIIYIISIFRPFYSIIHS